MDNQEILITLTCIVPDQTVLIVKKGVVGYNYRRACAKDPDNYVENSDLLVEGNVGIGTTDPQAKLHVGGTAGTDGIKFPDGTLQTTASGWHHLGTKVWSGHAVTTTWQDLDLSAYVGKRNSLVFLKVIPNGMLEIHIRTKGDTERDYTGYPCGGATEKGGGTTGASIGNTQMVYLLAETDINGIIQVKVDDNSGVLVDITLAGFI